MTQETLKKIFNSDELLFGGRLFTVSLVLLTVLNVANITSLVTFGLICLLALSVLKRNALQEDKSLVSLPRNKNFLTILYEEWNNEIVFQSPSIERVLGFRPENMDQLILSDIFTHSDKADFCNLLNLNKPAHLNFFTETISGKKIEVHIKKLCHKSKFVVIVDFEYINEYDEVERLFDEIALSNTQGRDLIVADEIQGNKHKIDYTNGLPDRDFEPIVGNYKTEAELLDKMLKTTPHHEKHISISTVDMNDVVSDACKSLQKLIDDTNTEICFEQLPSVQADAAQLTHLIKNLFKNSMQYRGNNNPQICIDFQQMDDELVFCVQDNGLGVNNDDPTKIFTPYYRMNHDGRITPGIGLGLAVCKYIINNHKGSIWYENGDFHGSRFYFSLPTPYAVPVGRKSETMSYPQKSGLAN